MAKKRSTTSNPLKHHFTGDERVIALTGKEAFVKMLLQDRLKQTLEEKLNDEVEVLRYAPDAELADVFDELRGVGLMMQHKIVMVEEATDFVSRHRSALERYAEKPEPTATLILKADNWRPGKLDKIIKAHQGDVIKCESVKAPVAIQFLLDRAKDKHQRPIERNAAGTLVDRMGTDLTRLDAELSKLAMVGDAKKPISVDDVVEMVGVSSDEQWYAIEDAILSGDYETTLKLYSELIDLAGQADVMVARGISGLVQKLVKAIEMSAQGYDQKTICTQLKVFPFSKQPLFMRAAKKLGPRHAARLLAQVVELDSMGKSGKGTIRGNLERFCISFCHALR